MVVCPPVICRGGGKLYLRFESSTSGRQSLDHACVPAGRRGGQGGSAEKIAGADVGDVMTDSPVTVEPDTPIDQIASLMVDRHITVLPVTESGKLVGMVTKPGILRVVFGA